ncbi:MAG: sugar transferase [Muribaculaceae bacterium]|jgi:exopolysaccharide biosynthesis polyprenyl glycosylphosphotransferase
MRNTTKIKLLYIVSDYLTINAGWLLFNIFRFISLPSDIYPRDAILEWLSTTPLILGQVLVPLIMLALYGISGYYNSSSTLYKSRLDEFLNTLIMSFIGMLGIFFTALINDNVPERLRNYELMAILFMSLFVPCYILRLCITTRMAHFIRSGRNSIRTLVVGTGAEAERTTARMMRTAGRSGLKVVGYVGDSSYEASDGLPVYSFENIDKTVSDEAIGALIIVGQPGELSHTASLISKLYALNLPLFITPGLHQLMTLRPRLTSVTNEPLVDITNANIPAATVNLKRLGDIVVSSVALILLMPVYAVLALSVRLDSPGPVFYRQCRIGYHKRPFDIIKFRTMRTDAEEAGPALSADEDPRITRLGKILRKYRLDELPQFWNVLKGEMSLVGPRPEREFYIRQIMERQPAYSLIHQVRPGITSWGMVKFGYATSVDEMIERLRYDLLYLENVSFGVDLKILFHTVSTVLCGRGL